MNQAKFDSLPAADCTAIGDVSGNSQARAFGAGWQGDEEVALTLLCNLMIVDASDEFPGAFNEAIQPVAVACIEEARETDLSDLSATLDNFLAVLAATYTNQARFCQSWRWQGLPVPPLDPFSIRVSAWCLSCRNLRGAGRLK
jgi:hypothetical protein